jgi:3-oxoacyl-[acyl-carrier-protein] synthase-3
VYLARPNRKYTIMSQVRAAITGVFGYLPDYILTNDELATIVDTNDEWITTRTGIKTRHILKGEGQGTSRYGGRGHQGTTKKNQYGTGGS